MVDINKITIGTDPEFVMLDREGHAIDAEDIDFINRQTSFGSDSDGVFEVRSAYSHNTIHVVDDIRRVLKAAFESIDGIRDMRWVAGHYVDDLPLGGHIHIGNIKVLHQRAPTFVRYLCTFLVDGLSNLIDNKDQVYYRRRNTGYGDREGYRPMEQRGNGSIYSPIDYGRIEYRAPGSFLISPDVTFLNLVLAKVASMYWFNNNTRVDIDRATTPLSKLKAALKIMEDPIFKHEEDVHLGKHILTKYITNKPKIDWSQDFKSHWGLR